MLNIIYRKELTQYYTMTVYKYAQWGVCIVKQCENFVNVKYIGLYFTYGELYIIWTNAANVMCL